MRAKVFQVTIMSVAIFLLVTFVATAEATISSFDLGTLGGYGSNAYAINDKGEIVGYSLIDGYHEHAFIWIKGRMIDLGTLSGYGSSTAYDINNLGIVVGSSHTSDGETHAFRWTRAQWEEGVMVRLHTLGGDYSEAHAINDHNQVVGMSSRRDDAGSRGFLLDGSNVTELGTLGGDESAAYDINNSGVIVGDCETTSGDRHACMWIDDEIVDLGTLEGNWSIAYAINDANQVAGASRTAEGYWHAFLWQQGQMQDLGTVNGNTCWASGINQDGIVVGYCMNFEGEQYAFIWSEGVMTILDESQSGADGINKQGKVVGNFSIDYDNFHAVMWTVKNYK